MIDFLKVAAAQIILWHHFCRYGPMARTLESAGNEWVGFIGSQGRHAVQVFLVISGYLAVRNGVALLNHSSVVDLADSARRLWSQRV